MNGALRVDFNYCSVDVGIGHALNWNETHFFPSAGEERDWRVKGEFGYCILIELLVVQSCWKTVEGIVRNADFYVQTDENLLRAELHAELVSETNTAGPRAYAVMMKDYLRQLLQIRRDILEVKFYFAVYLNSTAA